MFEKSEKTERFQKLREDTCNGLRGKSLKVNYIDTLADISLPSKLNPNEQG